MVGGSDGWEAVKKERVMVGGSVGGREGVMVGRQ